jgi:hypothetical protein
MKHILLFGLMLSGVFLKANAQCGITFSVTTNQNLGPNSVVLTLNGTDAYPGFSAGIDWGDGSPMSFGFEESWIHTYSNSGTYQICLDIVTPNCSQTDYCNSYTVSPAPVSLCPFSANYALNGNTLTVNASGSGAGDPQLSFHPDVLTFLANPWDFSGFQFLGQHSGSFSHTYTPAQGGQTYMFCAGYSDGNDPAACESNDYCSNVTFGNTSASLENPLDFNSVIQVFPVPATTFLNIHIADFAEATDCHWSILSAEGKIVESGITDGQLTTVLLPADMSTGFYQLILTSGTRQRTVQFLKIVP